MKVGTAVLTLTSPFVFPGPVLVVIGAGAVSVQDVFDFLGAYFMGLGAADVNGVGGVTVQDVETTLESAYGGQLATSIWEGERKVGVRVKLPDSMTVDSAALARGEFVTVQVTASGSTLVASTVVVALATAVNFVVSFAGFVVMLGAALWFERSLRKMGRAGMAQLTASLHAGGLRDYFGDTGDRVRNRLRAQDDDAPDDSDTDRS